MVNIYAPNTEAPKYIYKKILTELKEEINNSTITEHFNTWLTTMEKSSDRQLIKKLCIWMF